ncbi:MAG: M20/M25/M40 family metallo-hydrolase [Spirochaetia bacterium]|nr:M20/M25/M40 family metallo-hydrolase [Spirochaetia bacterium]
MNDTISILQDLIRLDTQNPPGNEIIAVEYIKNLIEPYKVPYTIYTYNENRGNIVVELGPQNKESLIILSHLDVVLAHKEDWTHDPFAAVIDDGFLYGRGTLDMKYFTACALNLIKELAPISHTLNKGIIFVFSADEEKGSSFGLEKLIQEEGMKEKLGNKIVLNEGGGFALFDAKGKSHYLFESGQKSVARIGVKVKEDKNFNPYFPLLSHEKILVRVINTLQNLIIDDTPSPTSALLSTHFVGTTDEKTKLLIDTMSSHMITATVIHGGARNTKLEKNVRASVDFDCRLLPHISKEQFIRKIEEALTGLPVTIELLSFSKGYESISSEYMTSLILRSLQKVDPSITSLLPFITPGSNDGKFLHPLGCEIFGFAPLLVSEPFTQVLPLIHGIDERISLESVNFCYKVLYELTTAYLQGETT